MATKTVSSPVKNDFGPSHAMPAKVIVEAFEKKIANMRSENEARIEALRAALVEQIEQLRSDVTTLSRDVQTQPPSAPAGISMAGSESTVPVPSVYLLDARIATNEASFKDLQGRLAEVEKLCSNARLKDLQVRLAEVEKLCSNVRPGTGSAAVGSASRQASGPSANDTQGGARKQDTRSVSTSKPGRIVTVTRQGTTISTTSASQSRRAEQEASRGRNSSARSPSRGAS